jgi:Trypsin-like peptidase domain/Gram-negative bacterial TonB protein C-terminal
MAPTRSYCKAIALSVAAVFLVLCQLIPAAAADNRPDGAARLASVCPVVYPLDQFPTERGYRYLFIGNAFFINKEGYLITAAHVVKSFRDGGQPYILVEAPDGSRRLQKTELVAEDWVHDVAILRAIPNPFAGRHDVAFLPLTTERPSPGASVTAVSLFPADLRDSHTGEPPVEVRSPGQVIQHQFYADGEGAESELLLFNHEVIPGQSGSPVVLHNSGEVVGVVVGQWLNPTVIHVSSASQPLVTSPGAALDVHYAIALLRQKGIAWHTAPAAAVPVSPAPQTDRFTPPIPLSLVATPYPSQALFGGEVVLDTLIDPDGRIAAVNVVHGADPFLTPVVEAVHTWTFSPARMDGRAVETRIGIVFQFPQSFLPKMTLRKHKYDRPSQDSTAHGALPVFTVEPVYPPNTNVEGSVILYERVDSQGQVNSRRVLWDVAPLTAATLVASKAWRFVPGEQAGGNTDSAAIVVVTFRHP